MPAVVELLPVEKITDAAWGQTLESVVDVSAYTEAAVVVSVIDLNRNGSTTTVRIQTALENREEQYATLVAKEYASDPTLPAKQYFYLEGKTGEACHAGFGRFLRVYVTQASGAYIVLGVSALLKP